MVRFHKGAPTGTHMTRDEFELGYATRSGFSVEELRKYRVVLPCACSEAECQGWASISLEASLLCNHLAWKLPEVGKIREMEVSELKERLSSSVSRASDL